MGTMGWNGMQPLHQQPREGAGNHKGVSWCLGSSSGGIGGSAAHHMPPVCALLVVLLRAGAAVCACDAFFWCMFPGARPECAANRATARSQPISNTAFKKAPTACAAVHAKKIQPVDAPRA